MSNYRFGDVTDPPLVFERIWPEGGGSVGLISSDRGIHICCVRQREAAPSVNQTIQRETFILSKFYNLVERE